MEECQEELERVLTVFRVGRWPERGPSLRGLPSPRQTNARGGTRPWIVDAGANEGGVQSPGRVVREGVEDVGRGAEGG